MNTYIAFLLIIALAIIVCYYLYKYNFIKRKKKLISYEEYFNNLIFKRYIGLNDKHVIEEIKNEYYLEILPEMNTNRSDSSYVFAASLDYSTLMILQFKNEKCTSFYINSFNEKYSLPYWNYVKEFLDLKKTESYLYDSPHNDRILLSLFTLSKFVETHGLKRKLLYFDSQNISNFSEIIFKDYYETYNSRYLSLFVDSPSYFPRSKKPVFFFLCSSDPNHMKDFNELLLDVYPSFIYPSIVDLQSLEAHFNERR